jgi:hypothetical protein
VRHVARIARGLACIVAVLASYGWLDLLRHVAGPHLPLVLPLRGNGGGDDVSIVAVILVFTVTFAAIARIAPPRGGRSAIARGVLLVAFLVTVVALQDGIVEQSRPTFAWSSALSLAWPWLAATSAVLGTLLGTPGRAAAAGSPVASLETPPGPAAVVDTTESRELEQTVA